MIRFANIYIGFGLKNLGQPYNPPLPPLPQTELEFPKEIEDPTVEEEDELNPKEEEKEENEEEKEEDEERDEEDEEEDEEDEEDDG